MMFNRGNFVGARKYYLRKGGPTWTSRKAQRRELVFDSPSLFRPKSGVQYIEEFKSHRSLKFMRIMISAGRLNRSIEV